MWPNPQFPTDLVAFNEEILNGKLHFFVQCPFLLLVNSSVESPFVGKFNRRVGPVIPVSVAKNRKQRKNWVSSWF